MKLSELIETLQDKKDDYGDLEVVFGDLAEIVKESKIHSINDITVEGFIGADTTIVIWNK